ncbi:hypothetical protein [Pedobacter aquatilis]|uniref:hypothetical protein n=1 Tax=Pedobacter aquatilis TaxID=351343 RepID=UPI00292E9871|nr:hypothetical protein [Pedobacter aquatilis]
MSSIGLHKKSFFILLFATVLFSVQLLSAQTKDSTIVKKIKLLDESQIPLLVTKIETYNFKIDRDKFLLQRGYDVRRIENALPDITKKVKGFKTRFEKMEQT